MYLLRSSEVVNLNTLGMVKVRYSKTISSKKGFKVLGMMDVSWELDQVCNKMSKTKRIGYTL